MFSFHVFDHPMSRGFQNRFSTQYRCYSVSMLAGPNDRSDVEKGGKSTYLFKEMPLYVQTLLENALRNFACLTTGDVIAINYNEKIYELRVMETKPDKAVSIIECDMNVDFDAPLGYKEPERRPQHQEEPTEEEADPSSYADMDTGFRAFTGSGNRLDGKTKGIEPSPAPLTASDIKRGIPNYEFKMGRITFIRNSKPLPRKIIDDVSTVNDFDDAMNRFIAFSGEGQSLRKKGRKP
eukprot:superscaffoldBa00002286_g13768